MMTRTSHLCFSVFVGGLFLCAARPASAQTAGASLADVVARLQPKMVKIYGAGGLRSLEAYQSGMLISPEGHILTAYSYVLDTDNPRAVLWDGRRFDAKLLGADPRLEVAVLKIDAAGLPAFDLNAAADPEPGTPILALSNLFGAATGNEPASVQQGVISTRTRLDARRGVFETPYRGPVYVLDAVTNNPGAAGGALVTASGELAGMLGKELRNAQNNTWLNYAMPAAEIRKSVEAIRAGKFVAAAEDPQRKKPQRPMTLALLGVILVPDVGDRTPPYVDGVVPGSPAAKAGIAADDLVTLVDDRLIQTSKALRGELEAIDFEDPVRLTVMRGDQLKDFQLQAETARKTP